MRHIIQRNGGVNIKRDDKHIANDLRLGRNIYATDKRKTIITIEDLKPYPKNKPTCGLISLCKVELG